MRQYFDDQTVLVTQAMNIDQLDRRILRVLQADADITNEELAKQVHSSAATTQRRVKRLKDIGAIQKVVAVVDPAIVGEPLLAIVEVTMAAQNTETLSAFEALALKSTWVQQCYRVSTGPDFMLVLAVPDMATYNMLAASLFSAVHEVRNVRTFFVVARSKFGTDIPVGAVFDDQAASR